MKGNFLRRMLKKTLELFQGRETIDIKMLESGESHRATGMEWDFRKELNNSYNNRIIDEGKENKKSIKERKIRTRK